MVRDLVHREFGTALSLPSIGWLLWSMGLTPQWPTRRVTEQVASWVRQWLTIDYALIRAQALAVGAQILFADEAGVRSDSHAGTTWAPEDQTPVVAVTGRRFGLNVVSAVSSKGEALHNR